MEDKHVSHVSRALKELRTMGLVEPARTGSRNRYYRATSEGYALAYVLLRIAK